jgi:hypothetical protein
MMAPRGLRRIRPLMKFRFPAAFAAGKQFYDIVKSRSSGHSRRAIGTNAVYRPCLLASAARSTPTSPDDLRSKLVFSLKREK